MKKKTVVIGIVLVVCVVIAIAILAVQRGGVSMIFRKPIEAEVMKQPISDMIVNGRELVATVETEEEAQQIAQLYNITLVGFADSVAEYTTDRNVDEVIAEGEENGYPKLSINYKREIIN